MSAHKAADAVLATATTTSTTTAVVAAPPFQRRSTSATERHASLPPRRPTSARTSFVQQKLQSALAQAATEKSLELAPVESQTSFRCTKRLSPDDALCDRSVYRYRSEAASVSCTDAASPFAYASNFLPGVHFYTFLASKDAVAAAGGSSSSLRESYTALIDDTASSAVSGSGGQVESTTALTGLDNTTKLSSTSGRPLSASAKTKTTKSALRMWIPDTVVYGETGRAVWLSSDRDGYVQRCSDISERHVLEKLGHGTPSDGLDRAVVVYKEPVVSTRKRPSAATEGTATHRSLGNQLRLLSPGELKTLLSHVASSNKCFAVQQFVKCNGSKAFVVRAVYETNKPAMAWMISNVMPFQDASAGTSELASVGADVSTSAVGTGAPLSSTRDLLPSASTASASESGTTRDLLAVSTTGAATAPTASTSAPVSATSAAVATVPLVNRLCTSVQVDKSCTFVKLNERGCATVSELNQRIVKYVEHKLHIQLQSLVADYVKDAAGRWWLLQVKAFKVKLRSGDVERAYSLPMRLRMTYLSYRDSSILDDDNSGSDNDDDGHSSSGENGHSHRHSHRHSHSRSRHAAMAALAQRQVRKLVQCKCCLASYPKSELSFKMTLKMISEMLMRLRARVSPDKTYAFLSAAVLSGCDTVDASLAYESWSVCSFCYAIYERDQQLKRVETRFSAQLGLPNAATAADGLSRTDDRTPFALDPNSLGSVLPSQLTLCRLALVFNAIYDIPQELFDAEQLHFGSGAGTGIPVGARKTKTLRTIASKLYLRVSALGYTECIPLNAGDIEVATTRAPRGATLRRTSSVLSDMDGLDDVAASSEQVDADAATATPTAEPPNYWLPINIIRTIHFAAPRTPLQSKLKETSGIATLLDDESNIVVQFIRATEPPLADPTTSTRRARTRRGALVPEPASVSEMVSEMQQAHHSVLLGSTTIRMAQFRSAYVTKIDFYACMALSGELFNLKGHIGLERLRYVDAKLLTSQYRLRMFHGVFIPDESYVTNDPLSSEWMDALLVSFHKQARLSASRRRGGADGGTDSVDVSDRAVDADDDARTGRKRLAPSSKSCSSRLLGPTRLGGRAGNESAHLTRSTTSLASADNGEMDAELEAMIDRANSEQMQQQTAATAAMPSTQLALNQRLRHPETTSLSSLSEDARADTGTDASAATELPLTTSVHALSSMPTRTIAERKHELLRATTTPSRSDLQVAMLLNKSPLSSRAAVGASAAAPSPLHLLLGSNSSASSSSRTHAAQDASESPRNVQRLWRLMVLLNEAHDLQSREHAFSRWECHYALLGQKRSAVERTVATTRAATTHVHFTCTHTFYVAGTAVMLERFLLAHAAVALHLRNDMYASTRTRSPGEFVCELDLRPLLQTASVETTLDIRLVDSTQRLTPRGAGGRGGAPYLSVALHLAQLAPEPADALATGDFLELSHTREGLQVLRKIA